MDSVLRRAWFGLRGQKGGLLARRSRPNWRYPESEIVWYIPRTGEEVGRWFRDSDGTITASRSTQVLLDAAVAWAGSPQLAWAHHVRWATSTIASVEDRGGR